MKRSLFFAIVALAAAGIIAGLAPGARLSAQTARWNAPFSESQAKRGEKLYAENCIACHGTDLRGGERAPALAGAAFTDRWSARPLADLIDYTQVQMPLQSPGGLTRSQTADIIAFALQKNGLPAGSTDLQVDREITRFQPPKSAAFGTVAKPSTNRSEAFYTLEQAKRGQVAFNRNCAFCHSVDPKRSTPADLLQALPSTFGGHFIERVVDGKTVYPSVVYLYSKILSMPAFDTKAITDQERVDIASYILQANGLPAGRTEITPNPDAMRLMMLNEPGFRRLFNGKDFTGWNFVLGPNCKPAPDGCGKTDPGSVVRVEHETIVCECNVHGYFYTDEKYKDFSLRFDVKFEHPAELDGSDDEEPFSGGGGYLIFADMGAPGYPKSIEVEGRHRDMLDYFAIGGPGKIGEVNVEARRRAMRPLGQWNAIEIIARNGQVQSLLNGVLVSEIKSHTYNYPGHIVWQVQGRKMYWRNIRIKAE